MSTEIENRDQKHQNNDTKYRDEPLQRGRYIHGVGKICDFWRKSPFISETARDRFIVTMER